MNSREVFPLFVEAYRFTKTRLGRNTSEEYYQAVKRTEEESGLRFTRGAKRDYTGCLYIWRARGSRVYHIGWWIDAEHEDLSFRTRRQFPGWKKKMEPLLKKAVRRRSR